MPRRRLMVGGTAAQSGLATAGHQIAIAETALWRATNYVGDLDGILVLRPGLAQHGQTIMVPDQSQESAPSVDCKTGFANFFNGTTEFIETENDTADLITFTGEKGVLQTNAAVNATNTIYRVLSYPVASVSASTAWSFRFVFQGIGLPATNASYGEATPYTFVFRVKAAAATAKEFAIYSGGLYYLQASDSKYALISGSTLVGYGGWNTIEIRSNDTTISVYLNDALLGTIAASAAKDATFASANSLFEFAWWSGANSTYNTKITTPMYSDVATDAFEAVPISALGQFQYFTKSGIKKRCLLAAAGGYIYHDTDLLNVWRPLHPKQREFVWFASYRQTVVWTDHNGGATSTIWQWDGIGDPEELDDAPPLHVVFEHQQRLTGFGDSANPFRWYYSGDRKPNVWFYPDSGNTDDEFDEVFDAGYLEIPAEDGDRLTAGFGNYFDSAIVWTRKGAYQINGSGVFSYQRKRIPGSSGCEGPWAVAQVNNDLWYVGMNGLKSIQTTNQYGDLASQQPAAVLQNLWSTVGRSEYVVNREASYRSILAYSPGQQLVYMALPLLGSATPEHVFVGNLNTNQWYGPWTIDTLSMANIERDTPIQEVIAHGNTSGQVGYTYHARKIDFGATRYTGILQSALIDGRSIDPLLPTKKKTFHTLRLEILPRGEWPFTVSWYAVANEVVPAIGEEDYNQNAYMKAFVLGDDGDFRLDKKPDSLLRSGEDSSIFEIILDKPGYALWWQIETQYDLPTIRWEVEFTPCDYEVE